MISFEFNQIYKEAFFTDKRYIDIRGGRGRGGSHFGTDYFLFLITQPRYFRGYFVRQTFNDIKDSLFQDIKDRIDDNETLNIEDFKINEANYSLTYLPTGNKIISKGVSGDGKRTAKMKSLAGATHVLIEEADEIMESDFDQLDLSLRTKKAEKVQIIRIYNQPPKAHWIYRDYILEDSDIEGWFCAKVKAESDVLSIFSTYHDNLRNLQESTVGRFEAFKESNPDYYYNQVLGLISEGSKGRIYSGWKSISDEEYRCLEADYRAYVIDFGYSNDPNAIIEVKWINNRRYYKELLYETGLDNWSLAKKMHDLGITRHDIIVADGGGGGDLRIAELRRGFPESADHPALSFVPRPTVKGAGSIKFGISKVQSTEVYMTESSKNGWNEYQSYCWRLDADKNPTEIPIDRYNHIMDCIRYFELSKGTYY